MTPTVLHLFAGSGGCSLGFQRAGFRSLGSLDFDGGACRDLERLTGGPAFCRNLARLEPAELRDLTGGECPDVVVMSPPCKSFSGCMPAQRAREARYVDMSQLATRGMFLALEAWAPARPKIILLENVPRIQTRGAGLLAQIVALLQASGYATDQRTHDCGELGGLAQHRQRFLLVARDMAACPDFLRLPQHRRVRSIGEVLGPLPSPASDHGDELHRLPLLSALNWLRIAAIRAGKDWRDLPAAIGLAWDREAHKGRPDSFGVGEWEEPSPTVRAQAKVHTSRSAVADPRLGDRAARQNGGFGVEGFGEASHAILGEGTVRNTRASVADPRLACEPRTGAYGVEGFDGPSATVVGHHRHDNGPASVADPRLNHRPRRGTLGVLDRRAPSPTIRAHHAPRQAAAAVVDERGYPVPTHELVRQGDELVLRGPAVDLRDPRPRLLVIRAPDGTWHRPLTDRELAVLQGFPADCYLEGPSSSSKRRVGRREHIGNAIPPPTAEAIARECLATLEASADGRWRLGGGGVWVREQSAMEANQEASGRRTVLKYRVRIEKPA